MDEQLKVKIVVDKSDFNKGITDVKKELKSTANSTKQGVSGVSQEVKSVAGSIKQSIASAIGVALPTIGLIRKEVKGLSKELKEVFKSGTYKGFERGFVQAFDKAYKKFRDMGFSDMGARDKASSTPEVEEALANWERYNDAVDEVKKGMTEAQSALFDYRDDMRDFFKRMGDIGPIKAIKNAFSSLGKGLKETAQFKALANVFQKIKNSRFGEWVRHLGTAIKESIGAIGAWIKGLIAFVGVITGVVFSVSKLGDSIDKGSQKMNMSAEQYQKWAYAMELSGSSIEELREGYNQMSGQISQAVNGTKESQKAFQRLGVNLKDANGNLRSTGDIFEDVVVSLQNMDNATERTALAYKLFGESVSKLNPLLNNNANFLREVVRTQNALGSQMSDNLVAQSAKFQDAIATLGQAWQGFTNLLGETFLPIIQKIVI